MMMLVLVLRGGAVGGYPLDGAYSFCFAFFLLFNIPLRWVINMKGCWAMVLEDPGWQQSVRPVFSWNLGPLDHYLALSIAIQFIKPIPFLRCVLSSEKPLARISGTIGGWFVGRMAIMMRMTTLMLVLVLRGWLGDTAVESCALREVSSGKEHVLNMDLEAPLPCSQSMVLLDPFLGTDLKCVLTSSFMWLHEESTDCN